MTDELLDVMVPGKAMLYSNSYTLVTVQSQHSVHLWEISTQNFTKIILLNVEDRRRNNLQLLPAFQLAGHVFHR